MAGPGRRRRLRGPRGPQGPWVLGIESGGEFLSCALWRLPETPHQPISTWRLVEETTAHRGHRYADSVLVVAQQMLERHGIGPTELSLIGVGRGPGGFTGVRVGLATAAGLALGTDVCVWPVDSLAVLALNASFMGQDGLTSGLAVPLIDAKRSEVYGAAYTIRGNGRFQQTLAPHVGPCHESVSAASKALNAASPDEPIAIFGSGALTYGVATDVPLDWHVPHARNAALLAAVAWEEAGRDAATAPSIDPAYLRKSEAEISLERRLAAQSESPA